MAIDKCFDTGAIGNRFSPQERERYNYSKCTVVVRIMEFTTTLLNIYPEGWKVGSLCCSMNVQSVLSTGKMHIKYLLKMVLSFSELSIAVVLTCS